MGSSCSSLFYDSIEFQNLLRSIINIYNDTQKEIGIHFWVYSSWQLLDCFVHKRLGKKKV
uniref:Uncharacterized protein n=1 Tax=Rhizophora mucronata TaxID=61149 RepID=A0A2P2MPS7_RHIMU